MKPAGWVVAAWLALVMSGCGGGGGAGSTPRVVATPTPSPTPTGPERLPSHVVVIIQENRSFDNLFNGYPGADTAQSGLNSRGETVPLQPVPLNAEFDVGHAYGAFVVEYNNGAMNGWD